MNSRVFGDPCPNTYKYVEIHYACISIHKSDQDASASTRRLPPWLLEGNAGDLWSSGGGGAHSDAEGAPVDPRNHVAKKVPSSNFDDSSAELDIPPPRKPILVATDVIKHYGGEMDSRENGRQDILNQRIPITTPKPTSTTTVKAINANNYHQQTKEKPFGKNDGSSVAKIASENENEKIKGMIENCKYLSHKN